MLLLSLSCLIIIHGPWSIFIHANHLSNYNGYFISMFINSYYLRKIPIFFLPLSRYIWIKLFMIWTYGILLYCYLLTAEQINILTIIVVVHLVWAHGEVSLEVGDAQLLPLVKVPGHVAVEEQQEQDDQQQQLHPHGDDAIQMSGNEDYFSFYYNTY